MRRDSKGGSGVIGATLLLDFKFVSFHPFLLTSSLLLSFFPSPSLPTSTSPLTDTFQKHQFVFTCWTAEGKSVNTVSSKHHFTCV